MTDLTKLYKTQISLTEWLEAIGHGDVEAMRAEDNEKRERLRVLNELIGVPFDKPYQFSLREVVDRTPALEEFLAEHGEELCAARLIPRDPALPKLRNRGFTIRAALDWISEQGVRPDDYRVDFVPHPNQHTWSSIFVVNENGVIGEVIAGTHDQLTQGFHHDGKPLSFVYNFTEWGGDTDMQARAHLEQALTHLRVDDEAMRETLTREHGATFVNNYLRGYFEGVESEHGLWFIDYNRLLADVPIAMPAVRGEETEMILTGKTGSPGEASGVVRIVMPEEISTAEIGDNDILVCAMTTPAYVPLMQRAAAVVTDLGGILCHAAIVARELNKPCLVGTGEATIVLQEGEPIIVDATNGCVRRAV